LKLLVSTASAVDASAQTAPAAAIAFLIVLTLHCFPGQAVAQAPCFLAPQMHRPAYRGHKQ
jgi:hypothetical protein